MKILILSTGYSPDIKGGAEISTQLLTEALYETGHDVSVLTISHETSVDYVNNIRIVRWKSPNLYWSSKPINNKFINSLWHLLENYNPIAIAKLDRYFREIKPEVLIVNSSESWGASVWISAKKNNIRCIHILRSYGLMCLNASMFKKSKCCKTQCSGCLFFNIGKKIMSNRVDAVVGLSNRILKTHVENGYFAESKHKLTIPNFIENNFLASNPRRSMINPSMVIFGYLGRFSPEKGIRLLLETFLNVQKISPNIVLKVMGTGDKNLESELSSMSNKNIIFSGWGQPQDLFNSIDFLITPGVWHEPFGRVIIEAMANGIPVISTNRGAAPDIITHQVNGFIFDPDTKELSSILEYLSSVNCDYSALSSCAHQRAKYYSKNLVVRDFNKLISKL